MDFIPSIWIPALQHQFFIPEGWFSLYFEPRGTLCFHLLLKIVKDFCLIFLCVPFSFIIVSSFFQMFHYINYSIPYSHSPPLHNLFSLVPSLLNITFFSNISSCPIASHIWTSFLSLGFVSLFPESLVLPFHASWFYCRIFQATPAKWACRRR